MATGPVPTAHLAARAPESPQAARPRAFARSCCTVLALPSRPASRCSAHGSLFGMWQGPRPCLLSWPLSRPEKENQPLTEGPAPFFQLELGAGILRAEGFPGRKEHSSGRKLSPPRHSGSGCGSAGESRGFGGCDDGGGGRRAGGLSLPPLRPGL